MKKSILLKLILVIGLSLALAFNLVSVVRADDDSSFSGWDDPTTGTSTSTDNTVDNTANAITTNTADNTTNTADITTNTSNDVSYNESINTGNATTDLNTTSTNDAENEVENLAYTGIESNGIMAVVIIGVAVVAGYSLKKVREYDI